MGGVLEGVGVERDGLGESGVCVCRGKFEGGVFGGGGVAGEGEEGEEVRGDDWMREWGRWIGLGRRCDADGLVAGRCRDGGRLWKILGACEMGRPNYCISSRICA